jgi:hypothetical protein
MVEIRVKRRHAAILATDVAGCSWLMGEDEKGAIAAVNAHPTALIKSNTTEQRIKLGRQDNGGWAVL